MAEIAVRRIDDAAFARLQARAKARSLSVEALARAARHAVAKLTVAERTALIGRTLAKTGAARIPGAAQTPGWMLIREDRDER